MSVRSEFLTDDESDEFERIDKVKPRRDDVICTWVVFTVWLVLTCGSMILFAYYDATGDDLQSTFIILTVIFMLLIPIPILMARRVDTRAKEARDERVAAFKKRIRYERRLRPAYSGADTSPSRRQMQHEWYGDNPQLGWQDRERAEMFGLDVETYKSNMLENDRD
ncbi:hypothetical protein [Arthrobacter sp. 08Y14]|uniref:hypothetical protein n=1 Tax=Arthrobacter sp. 08Y14 TaxID=2058885 RepID=UPI000CE4F6D6|nr:hypothetical protein [Arthrobacter sp. 08Y14]